MKKAAFALLVTVTAALPVAAQAQGQTRTLDDLRAEYRAQCGKNGSRERLLVAYDRAIRLATGPAGRKQLAAQRAAVANPREPVCPEPLAIRPARPQPIPATDGAAPVATGQGGGEDACKRPAPNPRAAECRRLQRILGRWTSRRFGGVIDLVLTPDGTLSATIATDNEPMRGYGYSAGMQIFRNYRCRTNNIVWPVLCEGGEMLVTSQPTGKDREPFSIRRWQKGGLIALNNAKQNTPEILGHPLDVRLSNYGAWTRVGN